MKKIARLRGGNAFNEKARVGKWHKYKEVNLVDGTRLDGYDPQKGMIVSRKATDLDDISEASYRKYLNELNIKYPPGKIIRSNAYPELDGKPLTGRQYLELPDSNLNSPNLERYIEIAKEYNVELIFKPE